MILKPFTAQLRNVLEATDMALPISKADELRLVGQLPDGEETLLVLRDGLYEEQIKVANDHGTVRIVGRGLGESTARKFPVGTCVKFEITLAVVRHEVCNFDCCSGPCPSDPPETAGIMFPGGKVGELWNGSAVFKGDDLTMGVTGLPGWLSADAGKTYVRLWGTPSVAGEWTISVAAADKQGRVSVTQGKVTIK